MYSSACNEFPIPRLCPLKWTGFYRLRPISTNKTCSISPFAVYFFEEIKVSQRTAWHLGQSSEVRAIAISFVLAMMQSANAQWEIQKTGTTAQFRGIAAVSAKVCWAAGSKGSYARTIDGKTWVVKQVPGAEKLQFRSLAAFDADHATLLAIGPGEESRIYRTDDGGANWALQFVNDNPKAFYDAIAFWDPKHGLAFSDPVNGKIPVLTTEDAGLHWTLEPDAFMPEALTDEGAFSASGTCLAIRGRNSAWIATGGAAVSRVFHTQDRGKTWTVTEVPIPAGKATSGIFGLTFSSTKAGIALGGDYKEPTAGQNQIAFTADGGKTWKSCTNCPVGLQECAANIGRRIIIVGPLGTQASADGGLTWASIKSPAGFHTCSFVGRAGWAAGDNGLIARWSPGSI